ncbi:amidohydrolase [Enterobacter cancerogenus]|uniref:amidohydrolase n=1 Tax=Enterobacter cancerogenus TaxID=69218 RepID=UPI000536EE49|nr:amidohydrolase [Enterobacter cancerogenus]KGT91452.1 deaminase [Enterobacter cancerogenus]
MSLMTSGNRRDFLSAGIKLTAAGTLLGAGLTSRTTLAATCTPENLAHINVSHYLLRNVRLEEAFVRHHDVITATRTGLYDIEVNGATIAGIHAAGFSSTLPAWDAAGHILLPATRDMHIHLDKTFYGDGWRAPLPRKSVIDMIHQEEQILPEIVPTSEMRAEKLIGLLQSKGSTEARSHCNIDPISKLDGLAHLQQAIAYHRQDFTAKIVAFPQHGLLRSRVEGMMREAMKMGANFVGGLDPTNVDGAMEKSLDTMFSIALDFAAPVDIHLHETEPHGVAAIRYMLKTVRENPQLKGKVTISHAFALGTLSGKELDAMIGELKEQQFSIATTVPIGRVIMPLPQLRAAGVPVWSGTDTIADHWQPFGSGSMLEKANVYAQLYRGPDEFSLSRALGIATNEVLPLNSQGEQQWPKAQDSATMMLVAASCSAEAVAHVAPVIASFHNGKQVFGQLKKI